MPRRATPVGLFACLILILSALLVVKGKMSLRLPLRLLRLSRQMIHQPESRTK